jgi:hypothetical protein
VKVLSPESRAEIARKSCFDSHFCCRRRYDTPDLALQRVCRGLMSPRDVAFYHALAKFSDVLDQPPQDR